MPGPEEQKDVRLELQPTMGPAMNQYELLLNVVSRGGKLTRRPAIIAQRLGFGYPGRAAPDGSNDNWGFQYNAGVTSTPDYANKGGHTSDPTDEENGQYVGTWWIRNGVSPWSHKHAMDHATKMEFPVGAQTLANVYRADKYIVHDIVEGIDVEFVNGKLICMYADRQRHGSREDTTDAYTSSELMTVASSPPDIRNCWVQKRTGYAALCFDGCVCSLSFGPGCWQTSHKAV